MRNVQWKTRGGKENNGTARQHKAPIINVYNYWFFILKPNPWNSVCITSHHNSINGLWFKKKIKVSDSWTESKVWLFFTDTPFKAKFQSPELLRIQGSCILRRILKSSIYEGMKVKPSVNENKAFMKVKTHIKSRKI